MTHIGFVYVMFVCLFLLVSQRGPMDACFLDLLADRNISMTDAGQVGDIWLDLVTAVGQEVGMVPPPRRESKRSMKQPPPAPPKVLTLPSSTSHLMREEKEMEEYHDESQEDTDEESSVDEDDTNRWDLVPYVPTQQGFELERDFVLPRISEEDDSSILDTTNRSASTDNRQRRRQQQRRVEPLGQDIDEDTGCETSLAFALFFCGAFWFDDF